MFFHIDGDGEYADIVRSALEARTLGPAPDDFQPNTGSFSSWVHLDPSVESLERAAGALRAGWNTVIRWPSRAPARTAERLVELAEEAGSQVGILRPLRRLSELRPLIQEDRPAILTIAADLQELETSDISDSVSDLADLATIILGAAGLSRTEIESTPDAGGAVSAVAATIRYRNGALAQLFVSQGNGPSRFHLVAAGGGTVRRAVSLSPGPLPPTGEALARDVADFAEAIGRGSPNVCPLADALEALRIAERIGATVR